LALWCEDEAGPYQTIPYAGHHWCASGQPARQAHEYFRDGTAKLLTLFHPASGQVRMKGVTRSPNVILARLVKGGIDRDSGKPSAAPTPISRAHAHAVAELASGFRAAVRPGDQPAALAIATGDG